MQSYTRSHYSQKGWTFDSSGPLPMGSLVSASAVPAAGQWRWGTRTKRETMIRTTQEPGVHAGGLSISVAISQEPGVHAGGLSISVAISRERLYANMCRLQLEHTELRFTRDIQSDACIGKSLFLRHSRKPVALTTLFVQRIKCIFIYIYRRGPLRQ